MTESAGHGSLSAEAEAVLAVLERNRRTFAWKTGGLDRSGLAATTAATTMTIGGLVKPMALVETDWLVVKLAGQPYGPPWDEVDLTPIPTGTGAPGRRMPRRRCIRCGRQRCSGLGMSGLPGDA
jgi:hypothetical protein